MVSPGRLAEIIERMSRERRPERVAPSGLAAALAATGARGGRLIGPTPSGRRGLLAVDGDDADDALCIRVDLPGADGPIGRLEVWGAPEEEDAEAALRLVAAVCARSLENLCIERERADERTRARRLGAAASAVRAHSDPRDAVACVLSEARALVGAPAALMVAAGAPTPEVAAYDAIGPLPADELARLIPADARAALAEGRPWQGGLAAGGALAAQGFTTAAMVGLGPRAGLGVLDRARARRRGARRPRRRGARRAGRPRGQRPRRCRCCSRRSATSAPSIPRPASTTPATSRAASTRSARGPPRRRAAERRDHLPRRPRRAARAGPRRGRRVGRRRRSRATWPTACAPWTSAVASGSTSSRRSCRRWRGSTPCGWASACAPASARCRAWRAASRSRSASRASHRRPGARSRSSSTPARLSSGRARTGATGPSSTTRTRPRSSARRSASRWPTTRRCSRRSPRSRRRWTPATRRTVFHSENVGRVSALIAAEIGLPLDRVEDVRVAGLLHDVGKIGISDDVVVAAEPLTEAQELELRRHPEIGERMLAGSRSRARSRPGCSITTSASTAPAIRRVWSARRSPSRPASSRCADAFDRLTSGGPGAFPVPVADALADLERRSGSEFDPVPVAALRALVGRGTADITRLG